MRNVSTAHLLKQTKHDIQVLKRLQSTISSNFVDPLNLINTSTKWILEAILKDEK